MALTFQGGYSQTFPAIFAVTRICHHSNLGEQFSASRERRWQLQFFLPTQPEISKIRLQKETLD